MRNGNILLEKTIKKFDAINLTIKKYFAIMNRSIKTINPRLKLFIQPPTF